uniref:Uncharacterized protein n=1 Tax=Junco hyemalis TaxID=40217 RepID=A0A8C5IYJ7_JUNHY
PLLCHPQWHRPFLCHPQWHCPLLCHPQWHRPFLCHPQWHCPLLCHPQWHRPLRWCHPRLALPSPLRRPSLGPCCPLPLPTWPCPRRSSRPQVSARCPGGDRGTGGSVCPVPLPHPHPSPLLGFGSPR